MAKAKKNESQTYDIDAAERRTRHDLAEAQELRVELLQQLAANNDVTDELGSVEDEIAEHEKALTRFAEARSSMLKAQSQAARNARHEAVLAKLAEGTDGLQRLSVMAQDVLLTVATLHGQLAAMADERAAVGANLYDAASEAGVTSERVILEMHDQLRSVVHAATLPGSFADALWRSGLGRSGIVLDDQLVHVRPLPRDAEIEPVGDAEYALSRLQRLAEKIVGWSAQANGIKEAA